MTDQFERFKNVLRQLFMIDDAADLDFGIYRIMHQKQHEIEQYLNVDLKKQVAEEIAKNSGSQNADLEQQLRAAEKAAEDAGFAAEDAPKVKQLKKQIAQVAKNSDLEAEVYNHLATFFSRYYDGGDFISKRRFKKDVYAIPYEGEDVKLYWANRDQYYIKTSEYLHNYSFRLKDGKRVVFRVVEASQEQNNNKPGKDWARCFALAEKSGQIPVHTDGNVLTVNFTYELMAKANNQQKTLISQAFEKIKKIICQNFQQFSDVFSLVPSEKDSNRTLLQKHLDSFVARNTFDYFIHKDLDGFLSRELDFYIKNEVLFIDDIDSRNAQDFVQYLTIVKAVKAVGKSIISFLAGIENFQKKLWLKKKFVVQSDYCITLDRVPEELYSDIVKNDAQREEWVRLFDIEQIKADLLMQQHAYSAPLTVEFLKENQFLVLDTKFFSAEFKHKLIAGIDDLDKQCNGLLINSDNFQALEFLQEKFYKSLPYIYIDPPYNSDASPIIYKNGYKDSCWNSLINDRLSIANRFMKDGSVITLAIDHNELYNLGKILDENFGKDNRIAIVTVQHNPKGRNQAVFFSENTEYLLFYSNDISKAAFNEVAIDENVLETFNEQDSKGKFRWENYIRARTVWSRANRPDNWYPIYVSKDLKDITSVAHEGYYVLYPQTDTGDFSWKNIKDTFDELNKDGFFRAKLEGDKVSLYHKYYENQVLKNIWIDKKYQSEFNGTNLLKDIFGVSDLFSYPKSIYAVSDSIKIACPPKGIVLDYFAGSGTTGHAVILLNRESSKSLRKFILVEMGSYFNTVTKPRIEKVIYSKDWNNGKPVSREGISQCFKYMTLEQYEDTLNNLVVKEQNAGLFGQYSDTYLGYMLDVETRDSLFSVERFDHPFDVTMNITHGNESKETKVDMVETFNYLIGLYVEHERWLADGICTVEGKTRQGKKVLVVWRDLDKVNNEQLNEFFRRQQISPHDNENDIIYVNGDNNLDCLKREGELWSVELIEQEFKKRMFDED